MEYPNLEQDFQTIPDSIIRSIATRLTDCLEKCGLYYRLFTRTKTAASTRATAQQMAFWVMASYRVSRFFSVSFLLSLRPSIRQ